MSRTKTTTPSTDDNRQRWGYLFWVVLFLAFAGNVASGVLVAPTVIFISDKGRTGRMEVQNPTGQPREVSIHFSYGLPTSDSEGNVSVVLQDSGVVDPRSALEWVKAFPRKLIIPPGATQVVRLVANPPANIPDGEYWARIVVRSQEGETNIPIPSSEGAITTKLNMIMQTAIMLKYRKGAVTTQIELKGASAVMNDTAIALMVDLSSTGSASYVGTLACRLLDADKRELSQQRCDLAVYRDLKRRVDIPMRNVVGKQPYRIELSVSTDGRSDIAMEDIIPGNRIQYSVAVEP